MTGPRMDDEHIGYWRAEIDRAPGVPLGTFDWRRVLGWALDEIEALRRRNAAIRRLLADWDRRNAVGHSEDAIYAACAEELRDLL